MAEAKNNKKSKKLSDINHKLFDVILRPVVTEKSTNLSEYNKNIFIVRRDATKEKIKNAIVAIYKVDVKNVNVINIKGKEKRFKGVKGKRSDYKKAIVTLQGDSSIDFTSGI
jgi:large subunit ribosomal protein L23